MPPKPERSSDTPARGRIATDKDDSDAHEATSSSAFVRAPSYSPSELAGFRDFANVMRDAIGEKGMKGSVKELQPVEAAERGCLGTLKSLHRRGHVTFNEDLCKVAARGGQFLVLKWMHENSCPWNAGTCAFAAWGGHLGVLQWARAKGCPWDAKTCTGAAGEGHLEVLQWARENGCPWNADTCASSASNNGHKKLQAWILKCAEEAAPQETAPKKTTKKHVVPDKDNTAEHDGCTSSLHFAAANGDEAAVRALIKAGAGVDVKVNSVTPLDMATGMGHVAIVRALIEAGADINHVGVEGVTPLYMAAAMGHEAVALVLIEAGADVNKAKDGGVDDGVTPLEKAAATGHAEIARALIAAGAVDPRQRKGKGQCY
jgi:hypothetical protein|tara:strand:- start:260 stop:1381 length:1122 start_codon:yes stop_codon:yes gene_type:complete